MKRLLSAMICLMILLTSCSSVAPAAPQALELTATDSKADFVFVHPEEMIPDIEEALGQLVKIFREKEDIDRIGVYADTQRAADGAVEILIGDTNRSASRNAVSDLRDREFTVGVYEGSFVIAGADDQATLDAINHLYMHYEDFVIDKKLSSENNYTLRYDYQYDSIKVGKKDISAYTIVYPDPGGTYAEKDSAEKYAAQRLAQQISQLCGTIVQLENEKDSEAEYKLIIEKGDTKNGYSIKTEGKNIRIAADSIYAYTKAYDALLDDNIIPSDFSAEGEDILKETDNDSFVYVDHLTDTVYGDIPVKAIKIGDTDITEYRIIHHDYGKGYSGYGMNEIYAAQQLQRYIKYALGVELELATDSSGATAHEILIGNTDRTKEDTSGYGIEEYIIRTEGDNLIITGGEQRGTLYGVYSFLEDYIGCRFFAEDCEVIYKADEIVIPFDIDIRFAPTLEYRDTDEKAYQIGEIASKRKINSSFCRVMTFYQGSSTDFAGSGFVHTMATVYDLGTQSTQPCFSSEENYQKVLEKARRILKANPLAEILSITQNDNNNACNCKDCSLIYREEGSHAAPMLRFVNRLAEELSDEYPNIRIETLAYMFSTEVPKITKPHENVIIELCALDACCAHPLSDLSCETNSKFRKEIADWSAITDNLYVWYYVVEFTGNARNAPFMNFDSLYDTYTMFYRNGVKGVFNQAYTNQDSPEFGVLRGYLLSKLMWNPDMTREEFDIAAKEFIAAYYGEASDLVEEYFYMMASFARGRHFEQYSALTGILDTNKLKLTLGELNNWMNGMTDFKYTREETKDHINKLRKGFDHYKQFVY